MTGIRDELLQRIYDHKRLALFNESPKTLSLTRDQLMRLKMECSLITGELMYRGRRGTLYFMGVRIRVRHYERERAKKWHGPGAILTVGSHSLGSYGS